MQIGRQTGYPSIDKPWLRYFSEDAEKTVIPQCTLYEMMKNTCSGHLNEVAIKYYGRKIYYRDILANVEKTAKSFKTIGVNKGDIVIISSVTIPEIIYSLYALNVIGAIPNFVDPRTSIEGIRGYINEVQAKVAIVIEPAIPKFIEASQGTSITQLINVSPTESLPPLIKMAASLRKNKKYNAAVSLHGWKDFIRYGHGTAIEQKPYEANSCCMIVHTGGTTGLPKGVMLSNENVNAAFVQASLASLPMKRGMAFLNIMPPFIAYGIAIGIHTVLCSGWVSVLIPAFNPEQFDRLLLKHKPQGIIGVPSYFQKLAASKKMNGADLSFLRVVLVGGDEMKAETELAINKWLSEHNAQIHISKGYSMTEASAIGTMSFENAICTGSNGIPLPLTTVSAFKEGTDEELPYDTEGEICLSSPTMMLGYYNKQHETDQVIRVHQDGKKWVHSGDLGRVNKDGFVFVEGRLKRLIIRHDGFKVFPAYVESVIQEDQAIDTCCVVGQKDPGHPQGQLPVAFCVKKKDSNISDDTLTMQLAQRCKKELPEYSQPACIYFIDSMPLTRIGKVDYKALEEMSSSIPSN